MRKNKDQMCEDKYVWNRHMTDGGSGLMMDPACAAPRGGAESGEQPEERPNRSLMETGSESSNIKKWRKNRRVIGGTVR